MTHSKTSHEMKCSIAYFRRGNNEYGHGMSWESRSSSNSVVKSCTSVEAPILRCEMDVESFLHKHHPFVYH